MIYLLYFSTGFLLLTSLILLRNRFNFSPLLPARQTAFSEQSPKVSICIPARNEEDTIVRCVQSALNQRYPDVEVLVLDDDSADKTGDILREFAQEPRETLRVRHSTGKPDGWLGKSWACHQLSKEASGDILVFIDADTWLDRDAVSRLVRTMGHDVVDLVTVWPKQVLGGFWERLLIPLMYYALLSLLPVRYVHRGPRWMPLFLRRRLSPYFTAACGQFMAFKRHAYREIGGHRAVRDRVVEDVALARQLRRAGFKMKMYYGGRNVSCRMYRSRKEIRQGFRKNFLAGFGYNVPLFILAALIHLAVYVAPFITLASGILTGNTLITAWSALAIALIYLHRLLHSLWFGWNPLYGLLHPLAVLWYQLLGITVLTDYLSGRSPQWKGRKIEHR